MLQSPVPTRSTVLANMFDITEVDLNKDPGFYADLKEEVEEECKAYGNVEQVVIDQNR